MRVLLHPRAAAGRGRDHRVDVGRERVEVAPGVLARPVAIADVQRQRPAAALRRGHDHLDAAAREHADRRGADVRREHLLRAAGQQRHARPARAVAPGQRRQRLRRRHALGQQLEHRAHRRRQQRRRPLAPAARGARASAEARGYGERPSRTSRCARVQQASAAAAALGVGAERRQQLAVRHARRTRGLAGQAAEAAVDVRQRVVELSSPSSDALHQEDAPARRVHLLAQHHVGRARRQAEAAVDAGRDRAGHVPRRPGRARRNRCGAARARASSLNVPSGSSAAARARAKASSGPDAERCGPRPAAPTSTTPASPMLAQHRVELRRAGAASAIQAASPPAP